MNCPPLDQLNCPPDSHRTDLNISEYNSFVNTTEAYEDEDEFLEECCIPKGCICNSCSLPDCENNYILEIRNQSEWVPGKCCPKAECVSEEPNCTAIGETNNFWSKDCSKCHCEDGARVCYQVCEIESSGCFVQSLGKVVRNGEKWEHHCKECECINGEEKCAMSLCQNPQCNQGEYSFTIPGECCPSCFIKVSDSTTTSSSSSSSTTTTSTTTTSSTTQRTNENISTEKFETETPSISIESICLSDQFHIQIMFGVIAFLVIVCVALLWIIRRNAAQKRSFSISHISRESGQLLP